MKKYLMLMLILSMSFILIACGGEDTPDATPVPETPTTENDSQAPSESDDSTSEEPESDSADTPTDDSTDDSVDDSTDDSTDDSVDDSTDDSTDGSDGYEDPDFSGGDETTDDSGDASSDSEDASTDDSDDASSGSEDTSTDDSSDSAGDEPTEEDNGLEGPGRLNEDGLIELTLDELAYYDGTDGKPAYVAVDGVVYDMSDSSRWRGGNHNGYQAGQDLTNVIDNISPHGRRTLSRVPQVGILVESEVE